MKVAVIGAGTIGQSWAKLFASHGHEVVLSDPREDLGGDRFWVSCGIG